MLSSIRGILLPLIGLTFGLVGLPVVLAVDVVVIKNSGQRIEGELVTESPDKVTLRIAGIESVIARKDIKQLEYKKSAAQEYAERKAKLDLEDFDGRYALARDMFERKAYDLAIHEAHDLKTIFPDHGRVQQLINLVEQRLKLKFGAGGAVPRPTQPDAPAVTGADEPEKPQLLTPDHVNLIKLWELPADLNKAKPRVVVPRDTVTRLFKEYATEDAVPKGRRAQNQFRALKPYEQLQRIFEIRARTLYKDIVVRDDPPPLAEFRRINTVYVARYFRKHFGQGSVPGLYLFAKRPNEPREAYTNFYILSMAENQGLPFIDRSLPQRSVLLQWGLPRDAAAHRAPEVEGWRPFFTGPDDPIFVKYVEWIRTLYEPVPNYGVDYVWPGFGEQEAPVVPETDQATEEVGEKAGG